MNNNLSISFIICCVVFFVFYIAISFKQFNKNNGENLLNTFPFEANKKTRVISLLILLIGSIFAALFIIFLFPIEYRFGFQIASIISCIVSLASFFILNIINLTKEKVHYMIFSILFVGSLSFSICLGGSAFYFYEISNENILIVTIAVVYFLLAIVEVLYVVPNLNVTLKMNVEVKEDQTLIKKPHFVKLSFLEWFLPFGIIFKSILMLIVIILI